jgi:hypothetical protein
VCWFIIPVGWAGVGKRYRKNITIEEIAIVYILP